MELIKTGHGVYRVSYPLYTSHVTVENTGADWLIIADGIAIHKTMALMDAEWILRNYYLTQDDIDEAKALRERSIK